MRTYYVSPREAASTSNDAPVSLLLQLSLHYGVKNDFINFCRIGIMTMTIIHIFINGKELLAGFEIRQSSNNGDS